MEAGRKDAALVFTSRLAKGALGALALSAMLLLSGRPCPARTIRVPADGLTIQEAIDGASAGDLILVAPGSHSLAEPLSFRGKRVAVRSEEGPARTTLRRVAEAERGSVVIFDGAEGPESVLDGFTLTGGTGSLVGTTNGGGILCLEGASPTLMDLVITENRASYGGALYCRRSSPTLIDCTLSRNVVTCGGGVFCDEASPTLIRCTVRANHGSYASSGVHSKNGSAPLLLSCRIIENTTYYGGGVDSFQSSPKLVNCIIAGNLADQGGGAYVAGGSDMLLVHCTLVQNRARLGGGIYAIGSNAALTNCILFGNEPYSTEFNAEGCLSNLDPRFVRPATFDFGRISFVNLQGAFLEVPNFAVIEPDYRLRPESPAVDATRKVKGVDFDIDGIPRPQGPAPDIGAHEYSGESAATFRRGDVNGEGGIDLSDAVLVVRSVVGLDDPLPCPESGDVNDDGRVNLTDVVHLLGGAFLGQAPPSPPFPDCGDDPTPDSLGCGSYSSCTSRP